MSYMKSGASRSVCAVAVLSALLAMPAWADEGRLKEETDGAVQNFELGTVEVTGKRVLPTSGDTVAVGIEDMQERNVKTVAEAVATTPGVTLSNNSRNEQMFYVRGFDARQVPVYVDGIPLYVPYDGYADFSRFTTFDLSAVRVSKAGASLLYGPNTLGGAVNLVTRKPDKPFEGDVQIGTASGGERSVAVNLGGKQDKWYYQLGASYLDADSFPLPKGFKDEKQQPTDTGNYRENARRTDKRFSFKLGITPNESDEYAVGYVMQRGEKGNPVYTGQSTQRNAVRYWRWPYWDKDSVYFLSNTAIGLNNSIKTRIYYDTYKNGLDMYTSSAYAEHDPTSSYKDISKGASVEWANTSFDGHILRFAAHYKVDEHTDEAGAASEEKHYRDVTTSFVAEDTISLAERWSLTLGMSRDRRRAKEVYYWPTGSAEATNALAKLSYRFGRQDNELYGIFSRKTRFPTIKDRYSARMGAALPNPDLKPENASHFEIGARGEPWVNGKGQVSLFYSRIRNEIQTNVVESDQCGGTTCNQAQNIGRTRHAGIELSLEQQLSPSWSIQTAYTYLNRRNQNDSDVVLTGTPRHRIVSALKWQPSEKWLLRAEWEAEQGRKVSRGRETIASGGYGIANFRARYQANQATEIDFGVNNIGDNWYQLADGYPMPGRVWYANLRYRF